MMRLWLYYLWGLSNPSLRAAIWCLMSGLAGEDTKEAWSLITDQANQTEQISLQESWHSACSERLPTGRQNFWTQRPWHRRNFFLSSLDRLGIVLSLANTGGGGLVAGVLARLLIELLFWFLLTGDDGWEVAGGNMMLVCLEFSRDFWVLVWWGTGGTAGMMVNLWGSIIRYASFMSVLSTNRGLNALLPAAGESTKRILPILFFIKLLETEIWSLMV